MFTISARGVVEQAVQTVCVRNLGKTVEVSITGLTTEEMPNGRGFVYASFDRELIWDNARVRNGVGKDFLSTQFLTTRWSRRDGRLKLDGCEYDIDWLQIDINDQVLGDSTGDGKFDSSDLIAMFISAKYEDQEFYNTGMIEGDWNLEDREFDSSDLLFLFTYGSYESETIAATVPEPSNFVLLLVGLTLLTFKGNRKRG